MVEEDEFYDALFDQYDRDRDERWASEDTEDFMSSIRDAGEINGPASASQ